MDYVAKFQSQFREISYWLGSLLDREKIPDYEVNEFTIGTLSTIMNSNMELDSIVKILIDEVNRQNEEYEAKAHILREKLADIGLTSDFFSQASLRNLKTLSDVALHLKLKDCSYSSFALGMGEISNEIGECSSEILKHEKAMIRLETCIAQTVKEKDALRSSLEMMHIQSVTEEPTLEKRRKEKLFLKVKAKEYSTVIQDIESLNHKNGVDKDLFHSTLKLYQREMMAIRSQIDKLKGSLSQYHNLPPDISLARVKIAEARQELQHLEGELYSSLEVLNL